MYASKIGPDYDFEKTDKYAPILNGLGIHDNKEKQREKALNILEFPHIRKRDDGLLEVDIETTYSGYETLPEGYGLKGGAARALLESNILGFQSAPPRDIDLVRFSLDEPEEGLDHILAKKYMPNDYRHGNGVERIENDYFDTRDFTINEVIIKEGKIIFTDRCLEDTLSHTIRPTPYEYDDVYEDFPYKIFMKALRFYTQRLQRFGEARLELINPDQIYESYRNYFWIALNLDRSAEISPEGAAMFLFLLQALQQLPEYINSIEDARRHIESRASIDFDFTHIGGNIGEGENEYDLPEEINKLMNLPQKIGNRDKHRKNIARTRIRV